MESETQTKTEPQAKTQIQTETKARTQVQTQAQPEPKPETQTKTEPQAQPETQTKTEPQAQPETQTKTEPQAQTETQMKGQTQAKTETQTKTQTKTQPQNQTQTNPQLQPCELTRSAELLRSFLNVNKNLGRLFHRTASQNGLSGPQYSILMALEPLKEATQKNIGERTYLPKSTLSQAVDGLVKAGLIYRQQVKDNRREILLSLSEKGLSFICSIRQNESSIHQVFKQACETLSENQYQELLKAHLQISTYLETLTQELEQGE